MRVITALLMASLIWAAPDDKKTRRAPQAQETAQTALTGCLDQRGEQFVLASEADMSKVTTLKGKAFADQNFARYIGHKVRVHGSMNGDIFEVTKIDNVSDTCSPH